MWSVIGIVAFLAQCSQIGWITVLWSMIQVSYSKHHPNRLTLGILPVGMIAHTTELTAVASSLQDCSPDLLPVLRVPGFDFWSYRHISKV